MASEDKKDETREEETNENVTTVTEKVPEPSKLRETLLRVLCMLSCNVILPVLMMYVSYEYIPYKVIGLTGIHSRLVYTLRCHVISILPFALGFIAHLIGRSKSLGGERPLEAHQHTLEQFILLFINTIVMATYVEDECMKLIPVMILMWISARIVTYIINFLRPSCTCLLYGISILPNMVMLMVNLKHLCEQGLVAGLEQGTTSEESSGLFF